MTLVEIMVVVIVMALIATGVGYAVVPLLLDSKVRQAGNDVRTLAGAVSLYMIQHGEDCPQGIEDLSISASGRDHDPWGNPFIIECLPGQEARVTSAGADGLSGTEDDISSALGADLDG